MVKNLKEAARSGDPSPEHSDFGDRDSAAVNTMDYKKLFSQLCQSLEL